MADIETLRSNKKALVKASLAIDAKLAELRNSHTGDTSYRQTDEYTQLIKKRGIIVSKIITINDEIRKAIAEAPRPAKKANIKNINPHGYFAKATPVERRIVALMIREIGEEDYIHIVEEANKPNTSTPSNAAWYADSKGNPQSFDSFDRMMRGNYNTFAGDNL